MDREGASPGVCTGERGSNQTRQKPIGPQILSSDLFPGAAEAGGRFWTTWLRLPVVKESGGGWRRRGSEA